MNRCDDSLIFRAVNKDDLEELYDLLDNLSANAKKFFHPHLFDKQTITEICKSKKDHYFVMIKNDKIIGYSFLRLFGYEIPSYGCCIRVGYEGVGHGTALTKWTINKAKELGYEKIILKVYKDNETALRMYVNIGFKIISETEDKKQYKMEINLI
jgi:ribosomal protein S18 acetylase RimI-like enzyme